MLITKEIFFAATFRQPKDDDLERCNCPKAGEPLHKHCGWCSFKMKPRFECSCVVCTMLAKA